MFIHIKQVYEALSAEFLKMMLIRSFALCSAGATLVLASAVTVEGVAAPAKSSSQLRVASSITSAYYLVHSPIRDSKALGGFASSKNAPKPIGGLNAPAGQISLVLGNVPKGATKIPLYVVNRTAKTATFDAQDSSLFLVQEALNAAGKWQPIQKRAPTSCGNSFHQVFLPSGQMWQLSGSLWGGKFVTKLRFKLETGTQTIVSKPFLGTISPAQFELPATTRKSSK